MSFLSESFHVRCLASVVNTHLYYASDSPTLHTHTHTHIYIYIYAYINVYAYIYEYINVYAYSLYWICSVKNTQISQTYLLCRCFSLRSLIQGTVVTSVKLVSLKLKEYGQIQSLKHGCRYFRNSWGADVSACTQFLYEKVSSVNAFPR